MTKWFSVFALLVTTSLALPAAGQPPATQRLTLAGAEGVWMPMVTFRAITADLDAASGHREQVVLLTEQLTLERAQLTDMTIALRTAEAELVLVNDSLAVVTERAERARERLTRARRRLGWSFSGGALLAVVVTALVTSLAAR